MSCQTEYCLQATVTDSDEPSCNVTEDDVFVNFDTSKYILIDWVIDCVVLARTRNVLAFSL